MFNPTPKILNPNRGRVGVFVGGFRGRGRGRRPRTITDAKATFNTGVTMRKRQTNFNRFQQIYLGRNSVRPI